ncbi:MAG: hypothetical protein ACHQNV_06530 [Vicinamibacteria bacterium]
MASALAPAASADVTITETVSQNLAGRSAKFTQVTLIRGSSMRVDASVDDIRSTWVYDAAGGSITRLDPVKREAQVEDAALAAADLEQELGGRVSTDLSATGRTRMLLAAPCDEYNFLIRMSLGPNATEAVVMQGQAWVAKGGPGLPDYLAFQRSAAERHLVFSDRGGTESGDPHLALALARGQTELRRRLADLGGMPYAIRLTIKRQQGTLLALVDQRLRGSQSTATMSVTTDAIPGDMLAVLSDSTTVRDGAKRLHEDVRDYGDEGRIHLLGRHFWLGLGAGVSALESGPARDAFGRARWQPVIRLVSPLRPRGLRLSVAPVFKRYGSAGFRAWLIAPTAGLGFNLTRATKDVVPFGTLRAGPYFVTTPGASTTVRPGASLEFGVSIRLHFVLSGGYEFVAPTSTFNLSNWSLNAIFRVL